MIEETREEQDYIEAFNQGYELSKELGLKPEILKDLSSGNNRMQAMKDGMEQYGKELTQDKDKDVIPSLDLDSIGSNFIHLEPDDKDKDKGIDIDL